ncbi:HAMP domain-containing histidine kinase [Aetokthonos hydrillicola Thurmond2011]|jgi:signal transduction histidine kinase|uniref:histidine kinase n=1 Tax=Aetokthonos hydrillicola Thurmond2011 TaxID=2712845 RepID=A0AAP5M687_9CYAN|nr:HAMP domain-containing sensor histidine kinase [Aetokthonos hydrillicola]MBO3458327.1 HAMP domain-containing histidine kinase [Aetokthonos hydrillicola CCALA 1050]MBW4585890.1 HAMP domain-containing histidine kinase [Aetokthonos hydrillicola CCALA 1050]MDR9893885.1 HAMP domain-containing histidine kinase [Aetokthonos hydrillicola Thurmond2011]
MEFLHILLSQQFIPQSHCYLWFPGLLSFHVISDLVIALAYYSIAVVLVYFVDAKRDSLFNRMFLMFGTFIVVCGTAHVIEASTLLHPVYWLFGLVKTITAFISVFTAIKLISLLPKALALPSPGELDAANAALLTEVNERKRTEEAICKILDIAEQERILDTHHKQIEQEQLVAQLEQLNALKDNFLNTVSHELRTPLCNIMMAVQILQSISTDDQTQRYLEILQVECDRELELVNDLLDLQRVEAATTPLVTPEPLLLEYWLHNITESFLIRTQERQQTLQLDLPSDIPPLVSDHTSLARIFIELLNNACKYTPVGGKIILKVGYEKSPVWALDENNQKQGNDKLPVPHDARCLKSAGSLTALAPSFPASRTIFSISNSAEIPQAALPRVFDKFYRVAKPDDYKQNGSGLGLALVQKLVEQLQGTIEVESSAGWTTFTLKFRDLALGT